MDSPSFSIQNIFYQIGQFDRYAIFDFKFGSDAFKKYGSTVYGYIIYTPSERARLKMEIQSDSIKDDPGLVLLDGALQDTAINHMLSSEGFSTQDISRLSTMDIDPIKNQYDNTEIKEIPNTINIDFEPEKKLFSTERLEIMLFNKRIEAGNRLIPEEIRRYHSLMYLLNKDLVTEQTKTDIFTDPKTGKWYDDVLITYLRPLLSVYREQTPLATLFHQLMSKRKKERVGFICKHLGIAPKHIDNLKLVNEPAWRELMRLVYHFEPETLTIWGWEHTIYWDFERFIHIYLRHYKEFLINESSKGQGTGFQYTLKDIRRIINIVLEANQSGIEARLAVGNGFHLQNDKGTYYNGNYYSLKIDPDGRLMQFHPQENY